MGIVKRPAARARRVFPVRALEQDRANELVEKRAKRGALSDAEAKELAVLNARLRDIVESVKNLPPEPPPDEVSDAEIEERVARLPTTTLLDLYYADDRISFGPNGRRGMQIDGVAYAKSGWGRQARAVRAEIDHRIPRRRA